MPAANVKATLISEPNGKITGLGLCIEASNIDTDADAIRATFATAFDILRLAVPRRDRGQAQHIDSHRA